MARTTGTCACILALALCAAAPRVCAAITVPDFIGPFDMSNWTTSGLPGGTAVILPTPRLSYAVDLGADGPGVSRRLTEFSVSSPVTETITFDWRYEGNHASSFAHASLYAVVHGPSGDSLTTLVESAASLSGPFSFSGTVSLDVVTGHGWGLIVGGQNSDADSSIQGAIEVHRLTDPPKDNYSVASWQSSGMADGTTSVTNSTRELDFDYGLNLGEGGVPSRSVSWQAVAPAAGVATFNWVYRGYHAYFQARTSLQSFTMVSGSPVVQGNLVGPDAAVSGGFVYFGSASIAVGGRQAFGLRVTGGNSDSDSRLNGNIAVTGFIFSPSCLGDFTGDGVVNTFDLGNILSHFGQPGTYFDGDMDGDGMITSLDLGMLLSRFGDSCP